MQKTSKIIVTRLQGIGDVIMTTPILYGIKQQYPDAELIFITRPLAFEVVDRLSFIDKVLILPDDHPWSAQWMILKECRKAKFALFCDNTHRIAVLMWLAQVKERIGMGHHRKKFLTNPESWTRAMDFIYDPELFADILKKHTGINLMGVQEWNKFHFSRANCDEQHNVEKELNHQGVDIKKPYIVFSLYTALSAKDWPEQNWQELWRRVTNNYKIQIVLTGENPHKYEFSGIFADLSNKTSLHELGYLIQKSTLVVNGCSAPIHIARAFGVPTIGLYGPSSPLQAAPPENIANIVSKAKCVPCNGYYGHPCDNPFCMKMITVDEVYDVINCFLKEGKYEHV